MREKFPTFCNLCHQAVEVVGLHGLVESDDVGMVQTAHELCLTEQVLPHIVLFDLVSLNDFDGNLKHMAHWRGKEGRREGGRERKGEQEKINRPN